jgi:8-oxo-dGTP diphosphatase/(d)CTP diphosphatase
MITSLAKTKEKHLFSENMKFFQKAIIFHPDSEKFLALKRVGTDPFSPNCWDLPGGNVASGELHDAAIHREIFEEASLQVADLQPVQVVTSFVDGIYRLFIGYRGIALSSDVVLSPEHTEYRWVTTDEFLSLESADLLVSLVTHLSRHAKTPTSG